MNGSPLFRLTVLKRLKGTLRNDSLQNLEKLVRPERFELPTFWFVARRSIQLSYGRIPVRCGIVAFEPIPQEVPAQCLTRSFSLWVFSLYQISNLKSAIVLFRPKAREHLKGQTARPTATRQSGIIPPRIFVNGKTRKTRRP
jgi:hypothetical protein